jgi:hypothetical protein
MVNKKNIGLHSGRLHNSSSVTIFGGDFSYVSIYSTTRLILQQDSDQYVDLEGRYLMVGYIKDGLPWTAFQQFLTEVW